MLKYRFSDYKEQYGKNLRLAVPVIFSQLGVIVVQQVDLAMVGRLGQVPLAGVGLGGTVFWAAFCLCMGITLGLTPLVGEAYAKGDHRSTAGLLQNSMLLFPIVGIVMFVLQYSLVWLIPHLGQPAEAVEQAIPYYKYLVWSVLPFVVYAVFKQFLEGVGNTTATMIVVLTSNVVNIFFNWLLIYGKWGFPEMGAAGAGLSTLIARCTMPLMLGLYFIARSKYRRYFSFFSLKEFSRKRLGALLGMGFPIAVQMSLENGAFVFTSIMMGWLGTAAMAANQIAIGVANFAFMIIIGVGSATTIRVSHEYGRQNWQGLRKASYAAYHLGLLWNFFTAAIFIGLRHYVPLIYTDDMEVVAIASNLMILVAAFQISDGLQAISTGILRGIQDVKILIWIALLAYIVINIPAGYLLAFKLGWDAPGLWTGFIFGISTAAVFLLRRVARHFKAIKNEGEIRI